MYIDSNSIVNTNIFETISHCAICSICTGIINEPQQCLSCDNCFCKRCINDWQQKSKTCPLKCSNPTFKDSRIVRGMLAKLVFTCPFEKCKLEIPYEEILLHEEKCEGRLCECPTCGTEIPKSQLKTLQRDKKIESMLKEIEELKAKNKDLENTIKKFIHFPNGSKIYETPKGNTIRTISSSLPLPENAIIKIKFSKLTHPGHIVVGVSDKIINENRGYLGGDMGLGNWGIAGNGSLGEEGKWEKGCSYKQGDTIAITLQGSVIKYSINGTPNNYSYDIRRSKLYLTLSFYYGDEILELV